MNITQKSDTTQNLFFFKVSIVFSSLYLILSNVYLLPDSVRKIHILLAYFNVFFSSIYILLMAPLIIIWLLLSYQQFRQKNNLRYTLCIIINIFYILSFVQTFFAPLLVYLKTDFAILQAILNALALISTISAIFLFYSTKKEKVILTKNSL